MNVLLPIKPKFVEKILTGEKRYEFRKLIFKSRTKVDRVYIYSSSPVKKIVGSFRLGEIIEKDPKLIWEELNEFGGINEEEFFKYFGDRKMGFALEIKDLEILEKPIDPYVELENFIAPQNFCYLKQGLPSKKCNGKKI